jgi:hypothetical protein
VDKYVGPALRKQAWWNPLSEPPLWESAWVNHLGEPTWLLTLGSPLGSIHGEPQFLYPPSKARTWLTPQKRPPYLPQFREPPFGCNTSGTTHLGNSLGDPHWRTAFGRASWGPPFWDTRSALGPHFGTHWGIPLGTHLRGPHLDDPHG